MSQGTIVQCIGAVVDVQFPRDAMPKVYDALTLEGAELVLEVQQQLGDGVVRTIAMGSSDGLRRGMKVNNSGAAISVPVGAAALVTVSRKVPSAFCPLGKRSDSGWVTRASRSPAISVQRVSRLLWTKPNRRNAASPMAGTRSAMARASPPRGRAGRSGYLSDRLLISAAMP